MPILTPHYSSYEAGRLRLANVEDHVIYKIPPDTNWVVVQFYTSTSWTASAVCTIDISLDGQNFADFPNVAQTQSAVGVHEILAVTGILYLRVRVSTKQAGSDVVYLIVNAVKDNGSMTGLGTN